MGVQDWREPGAHLGLDWGQEEKMGSCSEVRRLEAEGLKVYCRKRCPGLPAARVLAPALPISNWVTSGRPSTLLVVSLPIK